MRILKAILYVDWGAAQRVANFSFKHRSRRMGQLIREAVDELDKIVAAKLAPAVGKSPVRVTRRVYSGWRQGATKTEQRIAFEGVVADIRGDPRRVGGVSFDSDVQWGDELLCGGPRALIYDTVGRVVTGKPKGGHQRVPPKAQRMVDMSIGADLLCAVRQKIADMHILVCDDDDIWPAIVTAKEWGGNIKIIRITRRYENKHLSTSEVVL